MATASLKRSGQDGALRGTGMVVLIVEDRDMRHRYAESLREIGFIVAAVADGEDGLGLLYSNRPKVLVLDVILPDIDGVEICRKAREIHGDQISIVFLSPVEDLELVELCLQSGGNDYLIKSEDIGKFTERVHHWSKARPLDRRQKHRTRTLAAIRAAVHGQERSATSPGGSLSSTTDADVAQMSRLIANARSAAGQNFGHSVEEKLRLLGYVAGVVDYWSSLQSHIGVRRMDYLQAVLRETQILSHKEIRLMLAAWEELSAEETFASALQHGTRDSLKSKSRGESFVATGLRGVETAHPDHDRLERVISGAKVALGG